MRALLVPILYDQLKITGTNPKYWYQECQEASHRIITQPNSHRSILSLLLLTRLEGGHIRSTQNSSCRGPARRREAASARDEGAVEP